MAARTSPPTWLAERAVSAFGPRGARRRRVPAAPGSPRPAPRAGAVAPPTALAAALAAAWLLVAPPSADLAGQAFRSALGPVAFDTAWYGGHSTLGYSVALGPLGALLGPRLLGAASVVVAAALFAALARGAFGEARRVRLGALWLAGGVAAQLLTGRVTFLLGVAVGLGALLAAQRVRGPLAPGLAALTSLASPVAGAFLALAGAAGALGGGTRSARRRGAGLGLGALAALLALAALFPERGSEPFAPSAFWPALVALGALAAAFARAGQRVLAAGAALAALACAAAFAVPNPVGGNATRLGALFAGPLLACAPVGRRGPALVLAALALGYWQLQAPVRDLVVAAGDPSTRAGFYAPLLAALRERGVEGRTGGRVEVPLTRARGEADLLARHVGLARGWERQLDRARNPLFYRPGLDGPALRAWLRDDAVGWVALPDVPLDRSALAEAALLRAGVPGVRQVWRSAHWRLFAVAGARPLVQGPARLTDLGADALALRAARPGAVLLRVRWSPYWALVRGAGCVTRAPGDWMLLRLAAPGAVRVAQRFSLRRGLGHAAGRRCAGGR